MKATSPFGLVALALALLTALPPVGARADDAAQARAHFRRGETHFAMGRFAEALKEYEAAFEAKPLPGFLFNIGQCHRNLGNLEQAVFSYKKYLQLKPEAPNRAAVEELITDLERQIAAARNAARTTVNPPPPRPDLVLVVPPPPPRAPVYTRWWFWTVAGAVVAGSVVAIYYGTRPGSSGPPSSALGNIDFR